MEDAKATNECSKGIRSDAGTVTVRGGTVKVEGKVKGKESSIAAFSGVSIAGTVTTKGGTDA